MTAFGPYAGEQIVDFTELNGRNIFLITGPTGAGKTTIFDAICYAIYGKGSGRDRDGENMRSDFAAGDVLTAVELEFELNSRRYSIKRKPKQWKKKSKGDGFTEQAAEAEFQEMDNEDQVTIAGVREVNEKIHQVLGITYEQFKQIIMIPQGEFRELLTSDSKDREGILQRIFGTEGFKKVQERLNDWEKNLRDEVKMIVGQRDATVKRLDSGSHETLGDLIAMPVLNIPAILEEAEKFVGRDEREEAQLQAAVEAQERMGAVKQQEIFQAQAINHKFALREDAARHKELMEGKADEYAGKEQRLALGRKALALRGLEDNWQSRQDNVARKQAGLTTVTGQLEALQSLAASAKQAYDHELNREPVRAELQERLTVLKGYTDKVRALDKARTEYSDAGQKLHQAQQELSAAKADVESLKAGIQDIRGRLAEAHSASAGYAAQSAELDSKSQVYDRILKLKTENEKLEHFRRLFEGKQNTVKREKDMLDSQQNRVDELKVRFFQGQAGLLAKTLREGEACPVCGSHHHPHPAVLAAGIPTEEELKTADAAVRRAGELYEKVRSGFEQVKAEGIAQRRLVENLQQELTGLLGETVSELERDALTQFVKQQADVLADQIAALKRSVKELEERKQQEQTFSQNLAESERLLTAAEARLENCNQRYTACFAQAQAVKKSVADLIAELPVQLHGEGELRREIGRTEEALRKAQEAFKAAETKYRQNTVDYEKKLTEQELCASTLTEALADLQSAELKWMQELQGAGFGSREEYDLAKMTEQATAALEQEIREYREKVHLARENYRKTAEEVEGLAMLDVACLQEELAAIQRDKASISGQKTEIFARVRHNRDTLITIRALTDQLGGKEQEYGVIAELANTAKGNNEEKLSFERYVLAAFFEDIIEAANRRLGKMTGGRFEMSRIAEKGKGTAQSGLEISVFDNYTGRSRHVKTLSGGESFKASLALALGLADVVQAYAGGISLETMFIDEGFGTLDPESLDNAIQCLVELQHAGRLVGIISHVPELKSSIDARLEITAGKDGSSAQFCIL
jgi:exonuclease SbcC